MSIENLKSYGAYIPPPFTELRLRFLGDFPAPHAVVEIHPTGVTSFPLSYPPKEITQ